MHYFQFLLIFKINQTCPVSFPYPHSKKSKKIRFYTECWGVLKSTLPTFFSL